VHPDKDDTKFVAASAHQVTFGELRREAAEEAMEAVQAGDRADAAHRTVDGLTRREQSALDDLEKMLRDECSPEEIRARADEVAAVHRELTEARVEAREADAVADREQAQANRAARHLEDAEAGKPRLVAEQAAWQPAVEEHVEPGNLEDRLG
jgi:hypothetical protein